MKLTSQTLEKAIIFAVEKHQSQLRKGNGMPYITHPMAVMLILGNIKKSKNSILLAICCLLHDVVEDCNVTLDEIANQFGYNVASIVSELTSDKEQISVIGKKQYLSEKMLGMSSYSLCIKLADRLHNLTDIGNTEKDLNKIEETNYIIDQLLKKRKLTKTHRKLIKMIKQKIKR